VIPSSPDFAYGQAEKRHSGSTNLRIREAGERPAQAQGCDPRGLATSYEGPARGSQAADGGAGDPGDGQWL